MRVVFANTPLGRVDSSKASPAALLIALQLYTYRNTCIIIIIIIIDHLRMQPEGYGAAIYIFWALGPYRNFVSPVSSLAVLRGPPLFSLSFCLHSFL